MSGERIEGAVQRIEAALARIAEAADAAGPQAQAASTAATRHEALRQTVANTLEELDDLIARMER